MQHDHIFKKKAFSVNLGKILIWRNVFLHLSLIFFLFSTNNQFCRDKVEGWILTNTRDNSYVSFKHGNETIDFCVLLYIEVYFVSFIHYMFLIIPLFRTFISYTREVSPNLFYNKIQGEAKILHLRKLVWKLVYST